MRSCKSYAMSVEVLRSALAIAIDLDARMRGTLHRTSGALLMVLDIAQSKSYFNRVPGFPFLRTSVRASGKSLSIGSSRTAPHKLLYQEGKSCFFKKCRGPAL